MFSVILLSNRWVPFQLHVFSMPQSTPLPQHTSEVSRGLEEFGKAQRPHELNWNRCDGKFLKMTPSPTELHEAAEAASSVVAVERVENGADLDPRYTLSRAVFSPLAIPAHLGSDLASL